MAENTLSDITPREAAERFLEAECEALNLLKSKLETLVADCQAIVTDLDLPTTMPSDAVRLSQLVANELTMGRLAEVSRLLDQRNGVPMGDMMPPPMPTAMLGNPADV